MAKTPLEIRNTVRTLAAQGKGRHEISDCWACPVTPCGVYCRRRSLPTRTHYRL
jgi:hypothetical protein